MRISLAVLAIFLTSTAAFAQSAYKCKSGKGYVFQESPCPESARRSESMPPGAIAAAPESAAESAGPIEAGKQLCREQAPAHVAWKDPESLRVGSVYGGKMAVIDLGSVKTSGRQFFVDVNAKNSYGGYAGSKPLVCYTSQDGTRIVKVDGLLLKP
jgi:hypothetical protein